MVNGTGPHARIAYAPEQGGGDGGPRVARPLVPGIPHRVVDPNGVVKQHLQGTRGAARGQSEPAADSSHEVTGRLVVGEGITVTGRIDACDNLVVHGEVEATLPARIVEVGPTGRFRGTADVEEAVIAGRFDGTLTVRKHLTVVAGGRITGKVRYTDLTVETGGQLSGDMQLIGEEPEAPAPEAAASEPAADAEPAQSAAAVEPAEAAQSEEPRQHRNGAEDSEPALAGARRRFQHSERAKRLRELAESDAN